MKQIYTEQIIAGFVFVVLMICFLALIGGVVAYVMKSLGLHKMAAGRQIEYAWLAWVPMGSDWIIGKIAEEYDEQRGVERKWSSIMLTLSVICLIGVVILCTICFLAVSVVEMKYGNAELPDSAAVWVVIGIYIPVILWAILLMAYSVCYAICLYKIFESAVPEESLKYWLLSVILPYAEGICLFICKDKGRLVPEMDVLEECV